MSDVGFEKDEIRKTGDPRPDK